MPPKLLDCNNLTRGRASAMHDAKCLEVIALVSCTKAHERSRTYCLRPLDLGFYTKKEARKILGCVSESLQQQRDVP